MTNSILESILSIAFDVKQYNRTRITSLYTQTQFQKIDISRSLSVPVSFHPGTLEEEAVEGMKVGKQSSAQESRIDTNDCVYESILFR